MKFIAVTVVVAIIAFISGGIFFSQTVYTEVDKPLRLLTQQESGSIIRVPAVDENGQGVITEIQVKVQPGTGNVLANIENIFFLADTQGSIKAAKKVAQDITGLDLSSHDLIYTVRANASVIEGPSAGAAITVATIAALEGKALHPEVMITGTIRPDGSIGRVGQVEEKALAAKAAGADIFLIPAGTTLSEQGFEYKRALECRVVDGIELCETRYVKQESGNGFGIEIKEVSTIEEALKYLVVS